MQAHDAILQTPAHDTAADLDDEDLRHFSHPREASADERRPRWRGRLSGWMPRRARFLLTALGIGLAIGAIEEAARLSAPVPGLERAARYLGFGVDQVTLSGYHFTFDREIFDALDLANVRTFAALDTAAVKSRIERLPWIDTAEITRVFPGRLEIRVTERKPFALWSRGDRFYVIDKTGRTLAAVSGGALPNLPRFAGEGAAALAASFLDNLARYPEVASRLNEAERISERRWRLKLANKTTIELPADGEVGALEELSRDTALVRIVSAGQTTLDFRGPGRVAIRPEAPTAPSPNTGS
ncbi:cell division protein FtsQ/DivIB [Hyphomicrobium sp.]|uniref:cell division protein FtsQ/DivIB n=1 Tax=Hyphomicrobium sp. TaxID=82 RepID=UPI002E34ADD9|nr:FtsQ-type POTRA domain-containing protein [Hyphomicrobium sp.]HEX2840103.1 FtsQ-type POTRA domain-containing protein [Hyphomicrobium sp.]